MIEALVFVYALAVFGAGLLGAWLPRRFQMTHTGTQLTLSFVAGLMLGVAFFHMIPHSALGATADIDFTMAWLMGGLVLTLMLMRLSHRPQDAYTDADVDASLSAGCEDHNHGHDASMTSWVGLLMGMSIHSVVDGIALGAAVAGEGHGGIELLGLGIFLAILLHKPLDSFAIESVMVAAGKPLRLRQGINVLFAVLCPVTAILFSLSVVPNLWGGAVLPAALALSAGAFIVIALSDILPEIQFHSHDRFKLSALFLLGLVLAWSIGFLEPAHG